MIAPDSKTASLRPPGPSRSTSAGILLLGEISRNSGLNWSPAPMSTGTTS